MERYRITNTIAVTDRSEATRLWTNGLSGDARVELHVCARDGKPDEIYAWIETNGGPRRITLGGDEYGTSVKEAAKALGLSVRALLAMLVHAGAKL